MITNYLQVQVNSDNYVLDKGDYVIFDIPIGAAGIGYDQETGAVTLAREGVYLISFTVVTSQTSVEPMVYAVVTSQDNEVITGRTAQRIGSISSSAVFTANEPGVTMYLRNDSYPITGGTFFANLVVYAVDITTTYGSFVGYSTASYVNANEATPVILPIEEAEAAIPESAFTIQNNSVKVNYAGVYMVTARVQAAYTGAGCTLGVQVNGQGCSATRDNTVFMISMDTYSHPAYIHTFFNLDVGDEVSVALISGNEITLVLGNKFFTGFEDELGITKIDSPSVALSLFKIS